MQMNEKGGNTWVADEKGNEAYVTIISGQEPKLRKIPRLLGPIIAGLYGNAVSIQPREVPARGGSREHFA